MIGIAVKRGGGGVSTLAPVFKGDFAPPDGEVGAAYTYDVSALFSGAVESYVVYNGPLSNGLTLNAVSGILSGTPTGTLSIPSFSVAALNAHGGAISNGHDFTIAESANIASLFNVGDKGFIYDFTDKSTLYQLSDGTTPVVLDNDPIGYVTDLSGNELHGTQSVTESRPVFVAGSGAVGDGMKFINYPSLDLSASQQLTVIACVQTSSTANQGIFQHGTTLNGDANILMNSSAGGRYVSTMYGALADPSTFNSRGGVSDDFKTISAIFDRTQTTSVTQIKSRVNGEEYGNGEKAAGDSGTDFFSSKTGYVMNCNIGVKLNGKFARIIVINRLLNSAELLLAEQWAGAGGGLSIISEFPPAGDVYYSMLNSYGQSLSVGVNGVSAAVISDTTRFNDVMFTSGVHVMANGQNYSSLVPLVESLATESASPEGETIISGMAEMIHESGYSSPFIGVATGYPSKPIAQLAKGQIQYTNFVTSITQGWRRSREQFKHFKTRAFTWMQGESDTTNATYAAELNQLRIDLNTDIKTITSQIEDVWMLSYQLEIPKMALAYLDAADTYDNIKVCMPMYHLEHVDGVHLSSIAYKIAGAYFGKAYYEVITSNNTSWQPLRPKSHSVNGSTLDIVFNPVGTLAFDTAIVSAQIDYGFKLFDNLNNPIPINSVSIVNVNTVRIVASTTIPAGAVVRYGFSDPTSTTRTSGNLRDSQGDTLVFDPTGVNYPLHNWCVLFQRVIA